MASSGTGAIGRALRGRRGNDGHGRVSPKPLGRHASGPPYFTLPWGRVFAAPPHETARAAALGSSDERNAPLYARKPAKRNIERRRRIDALRGLGSPRQGGV